LLHTKGSKALTIIHSSPPSILVKRTGALGDVLETTPIIHRLRAENPRHEIWVQTDYPQVFWANSDVAGASLSSNLIYTREIDLNMAFENRLRQLHPIDAYSEVAFGDRNTEHRLYFNYPDSYPVPGTIVIHPCRNWPIRTLPLEFWQQLVDLLTAQNFNVVVTGTHQDHDGLTNVHDTRSRLTLAQQAALIASADCFICSESGPMILAQATGTPVIAMTTMAHPGHVLHLRPNDAPTHILPTPLGCGGCESRFTTPTTYWDCPLGHGDCVRSFSPPAIADLAISLARLRCASAAAAA
jgi:ADP-heptose:LPS heptosyltransferase